MNLVLLSGRVCADPSINETVSRYTLAVDKYGDGADFISCVAFGKQAEFVKNHVVKGMKLIVEGRINTGSYEKDGQKIKTTDVVVNRHEFAESKKAQTENGFAQINAPMDFTSVPEGMDEVLPFN